MTGIGDNNNDFIIIGWAWEKIDEPRAGQGKWVCHHFVVVIISVLGSMGEAVHVCELYERL